MVAMILVATALLAIGCLTVAWMYYVSGNRATALAWAVFAVVVVAYSVATVIGHSAQPSAGVTIQNPLLE